MSRKLSHEALKKKVEELETEVSKLKRSESELRDSEARFRAFMNYYPAVIYIKDVEGRHVFGNDAALKITNRGLEDFLGKTSRDFFPPDIAKEIEDRDEFVLKKGIPTDLEYQNEMPDGQVYWIKDIKFPIRLSEQTLLGGIAVDITEHKQREETLEIMQFAVDQALDRIAWIAPDGRFLYANKAACKEMEYTLEEVLSMRVSDINPNFPVERWAEHYQEVKKRGSMRLETQQIAGDGQTHDIEVSANYFKFGDREFMCSFGRDITERKEVERALQESQKDLRKLAGKLISAQEAERRRLAREMHDDISQRLAVLAIDAGKLEGSRKDPEDPFLEMLQDMKERLVNLSSDIHAISRQLHPSIIDDLGLVDAVRAECEGFTRREGVKVKYTSEGVPTTIPKDVSICIYRIIQEGIRNIAKHAQTKDAHVSLSCKDDSVNLTIRDNGIGFDPLEAKKKPGLGLASMEERVRLIQGDISVKSQPGKGTVIEVRAPLTSS